MDVENVYCEFEGWLEKIIKKEKPKKEIIAYNIGIFQTKVSFSLYLMGTKVYDAEDSDWACKPNYFPADRFYDFPKEYAKGKDSEQIEKDVIDFAKKFSKTIQFKKSFLGKAEALTAGFDDGDLHVINSGEGSSIEK